MKTNYSKWWDVVFMVAVATLYAFGLPSSDIGFHNVAIFVLYMTTLIGIINIYPTGGSNIDFHQRVYAYPRNYKIITTILMFGTDLIMAYHGMFYIAAANFMISMATVHYMLEIPVDKDEPTV